MEKKMIIFAAILLVLSHVVGTAPIWGAAGQTSELTITVTGFESSQGVAKIAIVNSKETFASGAPYAAVNARIVGNQVMHTFTLPYGEYAIKIFHDENANDKLDRMMFGIPKEKYGFSNNARAKMGPPEYEAAVFRVSTAKTTMTIDVR